MDPVAGAVRQPSASWRSVAQAMGLGEFLRLGKGEEKSGGRKKPAILANAVESVIAAVYLDGGIEPAVRLVRTLLLDETLASVVEAARAGEVGDYKSMLQEYSQAHGLGQPTVSVHLGNRSRPQEELCG